jgi:hypothetical protein
MSLDVLIVNENHCHLKVRVTDPALRNVALVLAG